MKTVEVLFYEFTNLYADLFNIEYLSKCNKNIKVIYTSIHDEPYFLSHDVDMIYIGSMADKCIIPSIKKLEKYKDKIKDLIEKNKIFLVTGNAIEIFSSYIEENNKKENGLGIFDYYIKKDMNSKHASWFIGKYEDMDIVGHRNQFSKCYNIKNKFIKKTGGYGCDLECNNEGICYKNFYATYLLGPFLILNPTFTKYILKKLKLSDKLAFEEDIMASYERRIAHFKRENVRFIMGQYG